MDPCDAASTIISDRGHDLLVVDSYKFSYQKHLRGKQRWVCTNRKCTAYLHTSINSKKILYSHLDHNHDRPEKLERDRLRGVLKQAAQKNMFERPNMLLKETLKKADYSKIATSDIISVKRSMYYARKKRLRTLANNVMEDPVECDISSASSEPDLEVADQPSTEIASTPVTPASTSSSTNQEPKSKKRKGDNIEESNFHLSNQLPLVIPQAQPSENRDDPLNMSIVKLINQIPAAGRLDVQMNILQQLHVILNQTL